MSAAPQGKPPARSFRMPIDGVRTITGRGTMVAGTVRHGSVARDDPVEIVGDGPPTPSVVTVVTRAGAVVDRARAGETVELLLRGVDAGHVGRKAVLRAR